MARLSTGAKIGIGVGVGVVVVGGAVALTMMPSAPKLGASPAPSPPQPPGDLGSLIVDPIFKETGLSIRKLWEDRDSLTSDEFYAWLAEAERQIGIALQTYNERGWADLVQLPPAIEAAVVGFNLAADTVDDMKSGQFVPVKDTPRKTEGTLLRTVRNVYNASQIFAGVGSLPALHDSWVPICENSIEVHFPGAYKSKTELDPASVIYHPPETRKGVFFRVTDSMGQDTSEAWLARGLPVQPFKGDWFDKFFAAVYGPNLSSEMRVKALALSKWSTRISTWPLQWASQETVFEGGGIWGPWVDDKTGSVIFTPLLEELC